MRHVVCFALAMVLASCGQESGSDPDLPDILDEGTPDTPDAGDAGTLDLPGALDDGPDQSAPLEATVQPADGAKDVSVLTPITVAVSHPVTSAAGSATVSLAWDRGFNEINESGIAVGGTLEILGKEVTFTPAVPLTAGMTYRFSLSGLVTAAGEVPAMSVRFRTWADPIAFVISRTAADTISQYTVNVYDVDGALIRTATYNGAGADQAWRTGDDVQASRSEYTDPESGHWTRHYNYNAAGADTEWGTADDVLGYHQLRTFDAEGQSVLYDSYSGVGDDKAPFSGDETYSWRRQWTFDERGLLTRSFQPSAAGPDTEWFTGDDTANGYTGYEYDADGRLVREVGRGRGPDDLWFTADDVVGGYVEYTLSPDGRREREAEVGEPGPDATWFTADDTNKWPTVYEYDEAGLLATETWYDPADKIGGYTEYDHDATGRRTAQRRYDAGPDGTFKTADDFVQVEWTYVVP